MKAKINIKQLIGIGSIVGGISVGTLVTVNKDLRTQIGTVIHQIVDREAAPPDTVELIIPDPALRAAIAELNTGLAAIMEEVDDVEEAIQRLEDQDEENARIIGSIAAQRGDRTLIYVVIDSILVPVDPDTVSGAAGWLRLLFPPGTPGRGGP